MEAFEHDSGEIPLSSIMSTYRYSSFSEKMKMKTIKVRGRKKNHRVLLYAISTCGWCKRMKKFLKENDVYYEYVDVDLCTFDDRQKIKEDILNRGGRLSYPTLVIDDKVLITGYQEDEVRKNLDI